MNGTSGRLHRFCWSFASLSFTVIQWSFSCQSLSIVVKQSLLQQFINHSFSQLRAFSSSLRLFFAAGMEADSPEWQSRMEAGRGGATAGATENALADTALA